MAQTDAVTPNSGARAAGARRTGWLALIVIGCLLTMFGGSLLSSVAWIAGTAGSRSGEGLLLSPVAHLASPVSAVTTAPALIETSLDLQSFPKIPLVLRVGTEGGEPIFVGVGPSTDVAQYLNGAHTAEVDGVSRSATIRTRDVPGSAQPSPPAEQSFWVASDIGAGIRQLAWDVQPGEWTVVVMNADGSVGISTDVTVGIEAPWAASIAVAVGTVSAGLLFLGLMLIVIGVFGWGRGRSHDSTAVDGVYPAALTGELRGTPSRWLWLVKWILVIPHWIVLGILSVAFVVTTVVAGFAILFTARYPRPLFDFNVGLLRWTWRVLFYSYSALGTDQYPPFSLERTDYPADFDVAYPERLSHGLVLVKSWLLAIPHLLIIGVLTGATWGVGWMWGSADSLGAPLSLLSLLVLVAAVILLFTGRYQRALFDFIMGINRWAFRVAAYVALMRDEYPPFRLDQGANERGILADSKSEVHGG